MSINRTGNQPIDSNVPSSPVKQEAGVSGGRAFNPVDAANTVGRLATAVINLLAAPVLAGLSILAPGKQFTITPLTQFISTVLTNAAQKAAAQKSDACREQAMPETSHAAEEAPEAASAPLEGSGVLDETDFVPSSSTSSSARAEMEEASTLLMNGLQEGNEAWIDRGASSIATLREQHPGVLDSEQSIATKQQVGGQVEGFLTRLGELVGNVENEGQLSLVEERQQILQGVMDKVDFSSSTKEKLSQLTNELNEKILDKRAELEARALPPVDDELPQAPELPPIDAPLPDTPDVAAAKLAKAEEKRGKIVGEFFQTEKSYNDGLGVLIGVIEGSDFTPLERDRLGLRELKELQALSNEVLKNPTEETMKRYVQNPRMYELLGAYSSRYQAVSNMQGHPEFVKLVQGSLPPNRGYGDFGIMASQRGPRYEMIMKEYEKTLGSEAPITEGIHSRMMAENTKMKRASTIESEQQISNLTSKDLSGSSYARLFRLESDADKLLQTNRFSKELTAFKEKIQQAKASHPEARSRAALLNEIKQPRLGKIELGIATPKILAKTLKEAEALDAKLTTYLGQNASDAEMRKAQGELKAYIQTLEGPKGPSNASAA